MLKRTALLCAAAILLFVCSCRRGEAVAVNAAADYPKQAVELISPAGVGGGYDLTIRSVAQCLQDTRLVSVPLPVTNKAGDGGGVSLAYLSENAGADNIISVFSAPVCLINLNGSTNLNYREDTTPIAKLITDYGCFAVSAESPYTSIAQVMEALKKNPRAVRIGGTSSAGSMDHIQFLKMAQAAGVGQLKNISYVGYEDGTGAAQLLGGHIDLLSTGISDTVGLVESGDLRVLATTAEKRVGSGIVAEIPTCIEQGIDATFYNWRGLFGPKDMPAYALKYWEDTLSKMVETAQWKDTCAKYGWDMDYMGHDDFENFLNETNEEYAKLLDETGLLKAK